MDKLVSLFDLQLFADGGAASAAGGDSGGEASGDTAQAAVVQEAVQKPVTKEQRRKAALDKQTAFLANGDVQGQIASGQEKPINDKPLTFAERMKSDPDLKKEAGPYIEGLIKERLKNSKQAEATLESLQPALEKLAEKYKVDLADPQAFVDSVLNDDEHYEEEALEQGLPVETVKELDRLKRESEKLLALKEQQANEQRFRNRAAELNNQIPEMKSLYPGFDMDAEMNNPVFLNLAFDPNLAKAGMNLKQAYYAVHGEEILMSGMQYADNRGAQKVARSIQANMRRPSENGLGGVAPSQTTAPTIAELQDNPEALKKHLASIRQYTKSHGEVPTLW